MNQSFPVVFNGNRGSAPDSADPVIGFVPSLEVFPLMDWAPDHAMAMKACPGYGSLVRGLLTGGLDAGVLPWELLVINLLPKPGQGRNWLVPVVLKACPTELVLGTNALKRIHSPKRRGSRDRDAGLVFGIEAKHSLTRLQILAWLDKLDAVSLPAPVFKVLPMNLMTKALEIGEIDGALMPAPWGMQAERNGAARVEAAFHTGEHVQKLILVTRRETAIGRGTALRGVVGELRKSEALSPDALPFAKILERMNRLGPPHLDADLYKQAAERYPIKVLEPERVPDADWFGSELDTLVKSHAIRMRPELLAELASSLVFGAD